MICGRHHKPSSGPKMHLTISTDPKAKQLTLRLTDVDWERIEQGNFYQGEQEVQSLLNAIGRELTRQLLECKVSRDLTLEQAGQTWYRKEASARHYHTLYGPLTLLRHT